jgi:hypothetical protein
LNSACRQPTGESSEQALCQRSRLERSRLRLPAAGQAPELPERDPARFNALSSAPIDELVDLRPLAADVAT